MNWKTEKQNNREVLISGDFKIIPCKNGKCQLREVGKMKGTFTDEEAAKAQAKFLMEQHQPKPKPKPKPTVKLGGGGRHAKILGHSACAVVKALGQAGLKYPEADVILKHHGIVMPKASVSVQLGFGRNENSWDRHGNPAPLSKEQIKELRGVAIQS